MHLPARVAPAFPYDFDPTARTKARAYERGSRRVSVIGGTALPLAFALIFWASGASRALADLAAARAAGSQLWADTLFIGAFAMLFAGLTLPVAFYSGHVREKRWGMTHRAVRDFAKDAAKSALLGTAFALALLLPFFYIARHSQAWWLLAGAVYAAYVVVSSAILPNLLIPLFYKVEPLPEGELRSAILDVTAHARVMAIRQVAVMKESAKSPRANAFIHGIGRTRRIVLFDTLLNDFHPREIRFTVAHEVGHLAHRDVPRFLAFTLALVFPEMWLLSLGVGEAGRWFRGGGAGDVAVVPLLLVLVAAITLADKVAFSWISRRAEAAADAFALEATQDPQAAESMMKRLCDRNLIDERPSPLLERLLYSHPAPARRIDAARDFASRASTARVPPAPANLP